MHPIRLGTLGLRQSRSLPSRLFGREEAHRPMEMGSQFQWREVPNLDQQRSTYLLFRRKDDKLGEMQQAAENDELENRVSRGDYFLKCITNEYTRRF